MSSSGPCPGNVRRGDRRRLVRTTRVILSHSRTFVRVGCWDVWAGSQCHGRWNCQGLMPVAIDQRRFGKADDGAGRVSRRMITYIDPSAVVRPLTSRNITLSRLSDLNSSSFSSADSPLLRPSTPAILRSARIWL